MIVRAALTDRGRASQRRQLLRKVRDLVGLGGLAQPLVGPAVLGEERTPAAASTIAGVISGASLRRSSTAWMPTPWGGVTAVSSSARRRAGGSLKCILLRSTVKLCTSGMGRVHTAIL